MSTDVSGDALADLRVVDLTWGPAGSVACHLLAEAGAEVLKVEAPAGDPLRGNPSFSTWNRSKYGLVLDLTMPDGRDRLHALLAEADVIVHGFSDSQSSAFALTSEELSLRYPSLIVAVVSGYPPGHPAAARPGWDLLVQARSGAMDEQAGVREGPVFFPLELAAWSAAYQTVAGILARLLVRQRTGNGGTVATSLYQGQLAILSMFWNRQERPSPSMARKWPLTKIGGAAARMLFECSDGAWMQLVGMGVGDVPAVIEAVAELGEQLPDPETMSEDEVQAIYRRVFRTRPVDEWLSLLWAADVPGHPVYELGDVLRDPQAAENHYVVRVDDPVWGPCRQAVSPLHLEPPVRVHRPAPALDEHNGFVWPSRTPRQTESRFETLRHPLTGVKVLDLGMYWAGPYGPQMLADLGADVIKLEPPDGDRMRVRGDLMFVGCSRGKRSISLDLKDPRAREVFDRLVRWADVVHHNLRMPAAVRLGVDEATVRTINQDIVYCHVSAYGRKGPRADWPGYDPVGQAVSGWESTGTGPGNPPMIHRTGYTDTLCAQASAVATLLGLWQRQGTGRGSSVGTSLLGVAAFTNSVTLLPDGDGPVPTIWTVDADQRGFGPFYRVYDCADGWLAVAAVADTHRSELLHWAGVDDPADLGGVFARLTAEDAFAALDSKGIPAELVVTGGEARLFDDETARKQQLTVDFDHPVYGRQELVGAAWDFDDMALRFDRPSPLVGQHTADVLRELGYSPSEIDSLVASGVAIVATS